MDVRVGALWPTFNPSRVEFFSGNSALGWNAGWTALLESVFQALKGERKRQFVNAG